MGKLIKLSKPYMSKHKNGNYYIYFLEPNTGNRKSQSTTLKDLDSAKGYLKAWTAGYFTMIAEGSYNDIPLLSAKLLFYREIVSKCTDKTQRCYKSTFNLIEKYIPQNKFVGEITTEELVSILDGKTNSSKRKDLITLNSFFNFLIKKDIIKKNPVKLIRKPYVPGTNGKNYTNEELINLFNKLWDDIDLRDICLTALYTGIRQSELVNLRWSQISNNNQGRIIIRQEKINNRTKSKRVSLKVLHTIPSIIITQRQLTSKTNFVFTDGIQPYNLNTFSQLFKKYIYKSRGLVRQDLNFHSLRHTFARLCNEAGIRTPVIKKLMDHSDKSPDITEGYIGEFKGILDDEILKIKFTIDPRKPERKAV